MAAAAQGKGGNKGRPPKYSAKAALTPSGAYFTHSQPLQPVGTRGTPIPLRARYRGYQGW